MNYNRKFGKLKSETEIEYGPIPLTVVTHHHEEEDVPVLDPETGEPTGETEHIERDWDTSKTELRPTAADYRQMGYPPVVETPSSDPAPEGYHYEARGWAYSPSGSSESSATSIVRVYETVPNPPPPPRRWSSLAMKRVLEARGSWAQVKGLLETAGLYDDFLMADYIAEDDEAFLSARAEAVKLYGEETVAAILDTIPQEAG